MRIRHLLGRLAPDDRCWIPGAQRQGDWYFLPSHELDGSRDLIYHHDEPVREYGSIVLVAEQLHRQVCDGGAVKTYVRGRVVQRELPTLHLRRWHLALRSGRPGPLTLEMFGTRITAD